VGREKRNKEGDVLADDLFCVNRGCGDKRNKSRRRQLRRMLLNFWCEKKKTDVEKEHNGRRRAGFGGRQQNKHPVRVLAYGC